MASWDDDGSATAQRAAERAERQAARAERDTPSREFGIRERPDRESPVDWLGIRAGEPHGLADQYGIKLLDSGQQDKIDQMLDDLDRMQDTLDAWANRDRSSDYFDNLADAASDFIQHSFLCAGVNKFVGGGLCITGSLKIFGYVEVGIPSAGFTYGYTPGDPSDYLAGLSTSVVAGFGYGRTPGGDEAFLIGSDGTSVSYGVDLSGIPSAIGGMLLDLANEMNRLISPHLPYPRYDHW